MDPITIRKQIKELKDQLLKYNNEYYKKASSPVSDYAYDQLMYRLKKLEEQYPQFREADSPTLHVGVDSSKGFKQVKHSSPMMSLDNTYNSDDVLKFLDSVLRTCYAKNIDYVIECKIDGLSIACRYKQGHLVQALTRGNGTEGDDVTAAVMYIDDIPKQILFPGNVPDIFEIRGEVFMTNSDFNNVNNNRKERGLEPLANPRNAAAGTLKTLDARIIIERPLHALFYATGEISNTLKIESQQGMFDLFNRCGIPYVPKFLVVHKPEEVIDAIAEIDVYRHTLDFPTDGAVIKVDRFDQRELLGATSKCPRWAKAFKFAPNQVDTELIGITVQVGRTGALTPVAELKPVWLDGSTIKRATLHNEDFIKSMDIRIGDVVTIEKAGEIIPAVVNSVQHMPDSKRFDFYQHLNGKCPTCGSPIRRCDGEAAWKCTNPSCKAQLERSIEHMAEKNALDLEGLGEVVAKALVATGKVTSIVDLFKLESIDFVSLIVEGGKMLSTNGIKLYNSVKASVDKPLSNWIYALGIPSVGKTVSSTLGHTYENLKEFRDRFVPKPDVVIDRNINDFLNSEYGNSIVDALLSLGINPKGESSSSGVLSGKTFCITGTLKNMDRHNAEHAIIAGGGKIVSAVSGRTDYLVAGENEGKISSKLKKAQELGITVLSEDDLLLMLKQ